MTDYRIIGYARSNKGRTSNILMIRECYYCHALIEFPSNQVETETTRKLYREYIKCPNCDNKVIVIELGGEKYDE